MQLDNYPAAAAPAPPFVTRVYVINATMRSEHITADTLSGVCHSVGTEPCLQEITEEQLTHRTANEEDGARLDIVAEFVWE